MNTTHIHTHSHHLSGQLLDSKAGQDTSHQYWLLAILISFIDQDGQWGNGKGGPADPHPSDCLGSLTNSIAYQGPIMGTNG